MNQLQILKSKEDASVNFIFKGDYPGYQEARYVRRRPDYMIVYVSSQTGCNQACRFCHLTADKQTQRINLTVDDIINQTSHVLRWYSKNEPKAEVCHSNFMSRGDSFNNPHIIQNGYELITKLISEIKKYKMKPKILISTIMPRQYLLDNYSDDILVKIFCDKDGKKPEIAPIIYYSLYSLNPEFRNKWIPNGIDPNTAFALLEKYQQIMQQNIKLHWAFIKNENDTSKDIQEIIDYIKSDHPNLKFDINIVRYNPYSPIYGEESSNEMVQERVYQLKNAFPQSKIKVVERVGFDVFASCGMFVSKNPT